MTTPPDAPPVQFLVDVDVVAVTISPGGYASLVVRDWANERELTIGCGYVTNTHPTPAPADGPFWCPMCQTPVTARWHTDTGQPVPYHLHNGSMHAVTPGSPT